MLTKGSEWHRWEPHIHAPGTVLNNQFKGPDAWEDYLTALEEAPPEIKALAVTDYYVTDLYEEVLRLQREEGRLPGVELIFPNIELRLDVAAKKGFVNLHLLVSPDDPDHLEQVSRFLSRLQFGAFKDRFDCTRSDLIRLGRRDNPSLTNDRAALQHGATQFKVNFAELRQAYKESAWAKDNILIAVAGGVDDGTSGVRQAADKVTRQEIEAFAHVIFASSDGQREFWLGRRNVSEAELWERYNGPKPCLHGSDAHRQEEVGAPFGERYSWVKGSLQFDDLRQACIEPTGRCHVGAQPPKGAAPSQVIEEVRILNAGWAMTPEILLNPGLVAIIGARGSGKTALADMIAAGCDAVEWRGQDREGLSSSFLLRAAPLLGDAWVRIVWQAGDPAGRYLDGRDGDDPFAYPRVRYLSQQFVEELCSSTGLTDGLLAEIERVIFNAHPVNDREGAADFAELLDDRASIHRQAREREAEAIRTISERIGVEVEKEKLIAGYEAQAAQKAKLVSAYKTDRGKLVSKGSKELEARHAAISAAAEAQRIRHRNLVNQRQSFLALQGEVKTMRLTKAQELLRDTRVRHQQSGMSDEQWKQFLLDYKGPVDASLADYIKWADGQIAALLGKTPPPGDGKTPYIADDTELSTVPLAVLEAEMDRITKLVSTDKEIQKQYAALSKKITAETTSLEGIKTKLEDAKGARERLGILQSERAGAYQRAFEALIAEQKVLEDLYAPLVLRLLMAKGSLTKLGFSVERVANAGQWAGEAENGLLDLRRQGRFRGRGSLAELANKDLRKVWETGSALEIRQAMAAFWEEHHKELLEHCPVAQTDPAGMREWLKRFMPWLFSTSHVSLRYGITYDGVDIRKLSPGTRGIVLLLLYLALDEDDDRPLIIDQPEENLDPKSVFDELVGLFVEAKSKRQVIIVTHNANLVINTDADQIIVAEAGPHPAGGLPPITYRAGGLENAEIRKIVCDILEGGERAFKERARRLRVVLER